MCMASKYAIINGIILDGNKDMKPVKDKVILVENGIIKSIADKKSEQELKEYEIIDMGGQYIMPGLINMHVHIPGTGKPKKKPTDVKKLVKKVTSNALMRKFSYKLCASLVKPEVYSGVTTIRTVGGILDYDSRLRDEINAGKLTGPRIIAANMAVSVPGVLKMPPEYIKAACDESHKLGLKVAAHVESTEGVRAALENGVDTIEHGAKPDEEIINLFKTKKAALITTISPALPYALFDRSVSRATEEQQYNGKIVFDGIVECSKKCLKEGIPVGLGTDTGCPYITHYDMWRELYYFHKYCGVTNSFALYTATKRNAEILGMDNEIGSIKEGLCADIIATKNNPLDDITALRNVSMVMASGKLINISKLKKDAETETELDKFL